MKRTACLFVGIYILAAAAFLPAQQQPASRHERIEVPRYRVYDHLFRQVTALEDAADASDAKGDHAQAKGLRSHFQNKIGLKDPEAQSLKSRAKTSQQQVKVLDQQAAAIIQRERAKFSGGKIPKSQKPPSAPPELGPLQTARNKMIEDRVDGLKRDLGPAVFAKLDQFAHNHYAAVKVKPIVTPPRPAGPTPPGR